MLGRVLLLLSLSSVSLVAQEVLEPLLITASRSQQSADGTAYAAQSISAEEIRDNVRRTLPEIFQLTPGVLVQKTANGHGSPYIRGFTGRQNLLLFDGVRINNSTLRSGPIQYWNTVDSLSLDHLEIIKSQGSVLYGSDAIGGTVNAFGKSSDFQSREEGKVFNGGMVSDEYRANGQGSNVGRVESQVGVGKEWGILAGVSVKDFGDIEDSSVGRMKGTGYPEQDYDLRADWAVDSDSTLTFANYYVNQDDVSRWHRTLNNPGWNHGGHITTPGLWNRDDYDQERSLSYLKYQSENPLVGAMIQRWSATLSYQTVTDSEIQDRNPASNRIQKSNIDLNTLGADLSMESDTDSGTWIYGFDFYRDNVQSSGFRNNLAGTAYQEVLPVADDSSYDLLGAYGQYIWRPTDAWEVTSGVRYTYAKASLGRFYNGAVLNYDQSEQWDDLVGSLRALYHLSEHWSVFGGISQSFRAPNLDDLTGNMTSKSGSSSLGSIDVNPERYLTYELGARHGDETLSMETSVFYTAIDNQITGVPVTSGSSTTINTNSTQGYLYGVEVSGAWRLSKTWTLSGFTAWQDGRSDTPDFIGGPISSRAPVRLLPLSGSAALRWTEPGERYWIEGRILASSSEDRTHPLDQAADSQRIPLGGTPSFLVVSIRSGWKVNEQVDLTCAVENLLDQDYRLHGSGQNESGLTGVFGVRYRW